jgi:hypothetical protein
MLEQCSRPGIQTPRCTVTGGKHAQRILPAPLECGGSIRSGWACVFFRPSCLFVCLFVVVQ